MVKKYLKNVLQERFGIELRRTERRMVSRDSRGENRGRVLISYVLDPFLLKEGEVIPHSHTNFWESWQIAQTFLDLGYAVDVVSYGDIHFRPNRRYDVFLGSRTNFQQIAQGLNEDCKKIVHLTVAHWMFNNSAQFGRLKELEARRGEFLAPRKVIEINSAIEHADCATILGNAFTMGTYAFAKKPFHPIPISTPTLYPWFEGKDFDNCRRNFLWFGSDGLVHKGLDLVLEVFSKLPDHRLYVCGPVSREKDFETLYYKELYQTPNIQTLGWVDIEGDLFREILCNCVALIYPSCSEGQSGGVVSCMHGGLIPIVSYESGVDVEDDFGVILKECSLAEIATAVETIATLPVERLQSMSRNAWTFARKHHTRKTFAESMRKTVTTHFAQA